MAKTLTVWTPEEAAFWVSLMWTYFTEVRPMGAERSKQYPEPIHFTR
jgi:hypothetical protein